MIDWHPAEPWSFPLAKAIFLNAVRLPAYRLGETAPDDWLRSHSHGPVTAAVVNDNGALSWIDGSPAPFHYLPELGLIFDLGRAAIHAASNGQDLDDAGQQALPEPRHR